METKLMVIRKNPNTITIEIQDNENGKTIEKHLEPLTNVYKDNPDEYFRRLVKFFSKYYKDSIITFYIEKKSLILIIDLLERMEELKGVIIEKDKSYYVMIKETLDDNTTLLNNNMTSSQNILFYFKELLENFDTPNILHHY